MSCYLRHMEDVLREAGIELTRSNRKTVDAIVKGLSGQKSCSSAWKEVKSALADPRRRQGLIGNLRQRWQAEGMGNRE
jgi:hypothetical protein